MNMVEKVVLVTEQDLEIGVADKRLAHSEGRLHRAFSVLTFNSKNELLRQRRARDKYHSGGLWSNTCCGHPRPDEPLESAAHRRLYEEMGFDCSLRKVLSFLYKAEFGNGVIEYEFDHVFVGEFNGIPRSNSIEVMAWDWMNLQQVRKALKTSPDQHTVWLPMILDRLTNYQQKVSVPLDTKP